MTSEPAGGCCSPSPGFLAKNQTGNFTLEEIFTTSHRLSLHHSGGHTLVPSRGSYMVLGQDEACPYLGSAFHPAQTPTHAGGRGYLFYMDRVAHQTTHPTRGISQSPRCEIPRHLQGLVYRDPQRHHPSDGLEDPVSVSSYLTDTLTAKGNFSRAALGTQRRDAPCPPSRPLC